jgi:hypothetical protein
MGQKGEKRGKNSLSKGNNGREEGMGGRVKGKEVMERKEEGGSDRMSTGREQFIGAPVT